jgi:hypothetical protein
VARLLVLVRRCSEERRKGEGRLGQRLGTSWGLDSGNAYPMPLPPPVTTMVLPFRSVCAMPGSIVFAGVTDAKTS